MKKLLAPMVATALLLGGAAAHAEDAPKADPAKKPHTGFFTDADANKDGFLTKDEMQKAQEKRLDDMFTRTDTNKDGKLSKDEMKTGRDKMEKRWKERREAHKDGKPDGGPGPEGGPPPADAPPPADGPKE